MVPKRHLFTKPSVTDSNSVLYFRPFLISDIPNYGSRARIGFRASRLWSECVCGMRDCEQIRIVEKGRKRSLLSSSVVTFLIHFPPSEVIACGSFLVQSRDLHRNGSTHQSHESFTITTSQQLLDILFDSCPGFDKESISLKQIMTHGFMMNSF